MILALNHLLLLNGNSLRLKTKDKRQKIKVKRTKINFIVYKELAPL